MEDYVGFHSEYFADFNWVYKERMEFDGTQGRLPLVRGYTRFASYTVAGHTNYYFIWDENFICITDFHNHKVLKLQGKKLDEREDFIAVNSSGIYIYNTREIYLFDFKGKLINKHKFGQSNYEECIYFYGEYAYYSETKTTNAQTNVWKVCMTTGEKELVYACHKADTVFDDAIKSAYQEKYKGEMQASCLLKTPSDIGKPHCAFLYADAKNVYVGYTRTKVYDVLAYILEINLETRKISVLDVIVTQTGGGYNANKDVYYGALNLSQHSGWVIGGNDLCEVRSLDCRCSTDVFLPSFQPVAEGIRGKRNEKSDSYYIKNGKELYLLSQNACTIFRYEKDKADYRFNKLNWVSIINHGLASIEDYTFVDNDMVIRSNYFSVALYDLSGVECNSELATFRREEISELIEDYKDDTETFQQSKMGLTLAEFRQNAPSMTDCREELIAFRNNLPNRWDYNAYVGILLGVGGPKSGDSACKNFAIGQGDNGNNTKKTLEAKGLMKVFEKYKGKKIDSSILFSDVENEILRIAPEYVSIRQKLYETVLS